MSVSLASRTARHPRRPRSLFRAIGAALASRRQRLHLGQLDKHLLDDIGLTQAEAEVEARRSVWDVPANWRR